MWKGNTEKREAYSKYEHKETIAGERVIGAKATLKGFSESLEHWRRHFKKRAQTWEEGKRKETKGMRNSILKTQAK